MGHLAFVTDGAKASVRPAPRVSCRIDVLLNRCLIAWKTLYENY
jgi:hypothetical protein